MPKKGILNEISRAKLLWDRFGEAILQERQIGLSLKRYQEAINHTAKLNRRLGISTACAVCAREGSGSCCFPGVENQYDRLLLLLNLLLGVQLPDSQEIFGKCFFLGPQGCKLMARHYYCQRFLCPELQERLGSVRCCRILEAVEAELAVGWEVEQLVRQWLRIGGPHNGEEVH
ncbi:MAG: hypothetical protein JRI66_04870 [Deltaproteobacteria bacterium]|nr:hypothetical protein [Deltaproteobacteria bacterium]